MTVPVENPINQVEITAGQTTVGWTWNLQKEEEIVVFVQRISTGEIDTLVLSTDYIVDSNDLDNETGGTLTIQPSQLPAPVGDIWTMFRVTAIDRSPDFAVSGAFFALTINKQLDELTRIAQDINRDVGTAVRKDPGVGDALNPLIPQPVDGRALKFRDTGGGNFDMVMSDNDPDSQADEAAASAAAALASEQAAAISESAAESAATTAGIFSNSAADFATQASASEVSAETSALNAGNSETAAESAAAAASVFASSSSIFAQQASDSEGNAETAETNAETAETNAATSETNAGISETNAATSETNAGNSETAAGNSETAAGNSETAAASSEGNAQTSETNASTSETNAGISETNAAASATQLTGTSATSAIIQTGVRSFITQVGKFFDSGSSLLITSDADPNNFMSGIVTSYSSITLVMNITAIGGSGAFTDWTIRVSGVQGVQGVEGPPGGGDLLAANNLSDVASAPTSRSNLGLEIGTDVQADLDIPSQAEAEAGTSTVERVWTSERVGQAIVALSVAPPFRGALVDVSSSQSIPNNSSTVLPWNLEEYDTDNIHDNSTNNSRLTVPSGVLFVRVSVQIQWNEGSGPEDYTRRVQISRNTFTGYEGVGESYIGGKKPLATNQINIAAITAVIPVVGGDYFEVVVFQNSGAVQDVNPGFDTWFNMEIIK